MGNALRPVRSTFQTSVHSFYPTILENDIGDLVQIKSVLILGCFSDELHNLLPILLMVEVCLEHV